MRRRVSLAHLGFLDVSPPDLVATAAEAGFDAVGLRISPADRTDRPFPLHGDAALLRRTRQRMEITGVSVLDVEVVRLDGAIDAEALDPVIDTAAELGASYLVVNSSDPEPTRLAEQFERLCVAAEAAGLLPALEFVPYSAVRTLADAVAIVHSGLGGILVDALHLYRSGGSPGDLAGVTGVCLPYLQICDAPLSAPGGGLPGLVHESRHRRLPPGEGELALPELLSVLPHGCPVSVEAPSDELRARYGDVGLAKRLREGLCRLLDEPAE